MYPRRGILGNVLLGVNTALGLAQFVKGWQNQSSLQEGRQVENLANRIKIGQSLAEMTGQPVQTKDIATQAEKAGIAWPKQTEEGLAGMVDASFRAKPPATVDIKEGGQVMGRGTPLAQAASQEQQARSLAETVSPVGAPVPLTPQSTKIGIVGPGGTYQTVTAPPGVKKIMTAPKPETGYGLYDVAKGQAIPTGSTRYTPIRPYETQEQKIEAFRTKEGIRQGNRLSLQDRKEQERDSDTGLLKPKSKTSKPTGLYANMKIAAQEHGLDLDNEVDFKKTMNLVQPGKMTDEKKQVNKVWSQVWKEAGTEPGVTLSDGKKVGYASLSPADQKAWRQQNFETKMSEIGQGKPSGKGGGGKQIYQLPKGGQMVPVDKATYDAYWKQYGGQK